MSSTIEITKTCEWCGNTFIARKCTTRYCCKRCAEHAYKYAKRKEHVAKEQAKANEPKNITESPFLTPGQCSALLGVSRRSIYNYLAANSIPCFQFKGKTLIRRECLNFLFDGSHQYELRPAKEKAAITEFYTSKEIQEKYGISNSGLYEIAKREKWPRTQSRGKTIWSKSHVDRYFATQKPAEDITEWYTTEEIQKDYGMTLSAIYCFVSKERIPKKKEGSKTFYSKRHFDIAKGTAFPVEPEYYTMAEAMAHFDMTRDQLYHYIKTYNITKIKVGRIIKISKQELDNLFAPPSI
ncbi:MAG: helix-turn-helix domain-containing protein [Candidatus Amulumruptor caecigallinarius]|nr:helix-turn-helix domain-containing protein [Candidatus Amulumruptor caecigallinarius]MCM1395886.1 helix-turn-helix domain-containing protein [Candidatus Amulumruptor caecigallinarius]MCM1452921.1 helix-turn-helix domain-containing protein [bacterium]